MNVTFNGERHGPTIKRDQATLNILSELSRILKEYSETLVLCDQIIEFDEKQVDHSAIILRTIQILLEEMSFEQAAVLLDLQKYTEGNTT